MDAKSPSDSLQSRKSKKHKHKKPKVAFIEDDSVGELVIAEEPPRTKTSPQPPNKQPPSTSTAPNKKPRKKRDSASSDEERWLTAIESGKLEDVDDELKKIKPKDPALMTARQRAMYDRSSEGSVFAASTLMSLPTGYKEKVMTAEAIQKAAIKSQKRKQMADEKREKDKKKTMERLLKKQESKVNKGSKLKLNKSTVPVIIYRQNSEGSVLVYPNNVEFPFKAARIKEPSAVKYCSMGCGNLKKYSCSQTGAALCSLACYKQNIAKRIL